MVVTNTTTTTTEEETSGAAAELRRGPWTLEEDTLLINYIAAHGEGRWNVSAKCAGLRRTGKSCRLRWLNYLKPDIKRGNLTPQEQILILELHSKWGNRWSKIAQHLPGRTDNEIKNYWRTRVQKQARQLKIDSNSNKFIEAVKRFWVPRLVMDKIDHTSSLMCSPSSSSFSSSSSSKPSQKDPLPTLTPNQESSGIIPEMTKPESSKQEDACACVATTYDESRSVFEEAGFAHFATSAFDVSMLECQLACDDWFGAEVAGSFWGFDESRQAAEAKEEVGGGEWVLS